jgi:ABC-type antimicrobial peptide transport system permease subunit
MLKDQQPVSTKDKVILYFKQEGEKQSFECDNPERFKMLQDYLGKDVLDSTLNAILNNKKLQPMNVHLPFKKKLGYKLWTLLVRLLCLIVCFYLLQLALFNVILLGIMILLFMRLNNHFDEFMIKKEVKYQNKDYNEFIQTEKNRPEYKNKNVVLEGAEQGKWLEFHLPESACPQDTTNTTSFSNKSQILTTK